MSDRKRSLCASCYVLTCAATLALTTPGPAAAQVPDAAVEALLEHSQVESVLGGFRDGVEEALISYSVEITPELASLLDDQLSVERLLPVMRRRFAAQGGVELRAAAAELALTGAISDVERISVEQPPARSLEEYVQGLQTDPPPQVRVRLVAAVAAAQAAGDFFVLVSERTREAAHRIAVATDPSLGAFEPITRETWAQRAQRNFTGAVVSFLHRYEAVPDEVLEDALREWQSEAGAWYVRAYSAALGETAAEAGEAIAAALGVVRTSSANRRRHGVAVSRR